MQTKRKRIFVSHAVADKSLVTEFLNFIDVGLGVNRNEVFCSSAPGHGIDAGQKFVDYIKLQLEKPELVIALLSPNYYESVFCLCELGAVWALSHNLIPVLVPPLEYDDVKGVLTGVQMFSIDNKKDLSEFRDQTSSLLNLSAIPTADWELQRDRFLYSVRDIFKSLPRPSKVPVSKLDEANKKAELLLHRLQESEKAIANRDEIIADLKKAKDKNQVLNVLLTYSTEAEIFNKLIDDAYDALEKLPPILRTVLYHKYYGSDFVPTGSERAKVELAMQEGFLSESSRSGLPVAESFDPKVENAMACLERVKEFLKKATPRWYELHGSQYDFPADIANRRFWNEHLGL